MKTLATVLVTLMCLVSICDASDSVIDLSHTQNATTVYWAGVPTWNRTIIAASENSNGVWIEVGVFSSGEHGGTHVDAPNHFLKDGIDLAQFPLERTIAEGVMIDCREEASQNSSYAATLEKVQKWEEENGAIPNGAAVLFYFGYAQIFGDPEAYLGTNDTADASGFTFPYITYEAANWLRVNRDLTMIGMDVPSPDHPQSTTFPVHLDLLPHNILILENVNIVPTLPARNFRLHASPLKVQGGTGIQTRIYAILHSDLGDSATTMRAHCLWVSLVMALMVAFCNRS